MQFSICMPAYNAEKTISRAIDSVLKQTYRNYELVIVNDGSSDNTSSIVLDYQKKDNRIKYVDGQKLGVFRARLDSLERATGEYIVFLDSDDFLEENALEVIERAIKESDADVVQYCAQRRYQKGKAKSIQALLPNRTRLEGAGIEEIFSSLVTTEKYTTLWNKAIRRSCFDFEALKRCPNLSIGEDNIIMLYVMKNVRRYYYITDILYNYMVFGGCTRAFKSDSYSNHRNRLEAKKEAILHAGKDIVSYKEAINIYNIVSSAKIVAYYPNKVGRDKEQKKMYYKVLDEIREDETFWELYNCESKRVSILYRIPLILLKKKSYKLLLLYKRLWEKIRRIMV